VIATAVSASKLPLWVIIIRKEAEGIAGVWISSSWQPLHFTYSMRKACYLSAKPKCTSIIYQFTYIMHFRSPSHSIFPKASPAFTFTILLAGELEGEERWQIGRQRKGTWWIMKLYVAWEPTRIVLSMLRGIQAWTTVLWSLCVFSSRACQYVSVFTYDILVELDSKVLRGVVGLELSW
jgi:hypothetical protein